MSWMDYFFSFKGRINRAKIWLFVLIAFVVEILLFVLFAGVFGTAAMFTADKFQPMTGGVGAVLFFLVCAVAGIAFLVASIAVTVKRLHDRDKSAAWLLVFWGLPFALDLVASTVVPQEPQHSTNMPMAPMIFVVIAGLIAGGVSIWAFVELYCLRGTIGENRFGPDPLAVRA